LFFILFDLDFIDIDLSHNLGRL